MSARAFALTAACVLLLAPNAVIRGQEPASAQAAARPAAEPAPDFLHQEELTGDWNGIRTKWKDKGVELESSLTQFYQGVSSGGTESSSEYNGTAQALLKFDLGKLADGTVFSVSAVNVTKLFPLNLKEGKLFAVSFGRYNLLDLVTFAPGINVPAKYHGKTAKHSFGGAITTKAYTPFDAIRQAIIPAPPINPVEPHRGSWSVNYTFRQYIVERAAGDGWGFFGQVSFADQGTSPITTFFDVGLGGNGLFSGRPRDEFGIASAYTDLSDVLKDNIDLLPLGGRRLRVEHQLEVFYDLHLAPWFQLTGDPQILRPNRPAVDTAIVPAVRLGVVF